MNTLTANDVKRNFGERLLNAQRKPIKISQNNKDAVFVMSNKDYEELKTKKVDYIKHCFENAKRDLAQGNVVDGKDFLDTL